MKLEHLDKVFELKYTFNSFKFMEDLDLSELEHLDKKPFKMIRITEILLMGALNHDPKVIFDDVVVAEIFEEQIEEGNLVELLEDLVNLLQDSSFFKNLQQPKRKKVKK